MTYEQYKDHYEKYGMCVNDSFRRKNRYTENQLKTRYEKYRKQLEDNGDTEDQKLRKDLIRRDKTCQLFSRLTMDEKIDLKKNEVFVDYKNCDTCHVFNKSSYPWMRYDLLNVVLLARVFHNRLDQHKHPITGKQMTREQTNDWWKRIIGVDRWNYLQDLARNGRSI